MQPLVLDAETERIAVALLRHLEWQADGFSLVFLFADVGPALQLADWLDERLALAGTPLQRQEANDDFARRPEDFVDALIASLPELSAKPGAVWLGLHRHPRDEAWNRARTLYLARLNERRFLLERDMRRPLVLVLPADFRPTARSIAPDIWHVRALSEELRARGAEPKLDSVPERAVLASRAEDTVKSPSYTEWQRIRGGAEERIFLPTAARAIDELLAAGRPGDAREVADEALAIARKRVAVKGETGALRDLSVALDKVGRVAQAQGDRSEAANAYRESLSLRRQLVERLGGTPQALRDLSVSLNKVGDVAQAQGDWGEAASAYRESLALRRQLVERLGGTPEALRDLSVSLDNVGGVAQAQGDWGEAANAYRESLSLRRQLVERFGGTPKALRDLSVSLDKVGRVAQAQGDWGEAANAYRESLALSRQLVERLGGTPEALRDLSVSLNNVGRVAQAQGDWDEAASAYRESLALRRQLAERLGGTAEALRDLSVSLDNVGRVAQARGDWDEAANAYRESLALRRELVERLGGTPQALQDVAHGLQAVSVAPFADPGLAAEVAACRKLAERYPQLRELEQRTPAAAPSGDEGAQ